MSRKHEWENLDQFRSKAEIYEELDKSNSTISDLFDSMNSPDDGKRSEGASDGRAEDNNEGEKDG